MSTDDNKQAENQDDNVLFAWSLDRDSEPGDNYSAWTDLLEQTSSRRGITRITVSRFARRGGYKVFAEVGVGKGGRNQPSPSTVIEFDAEQLAREAYQHAKIDHRRTATTHYRLQTWHTSTKKNEDDRKGDYATIRLDASSDNQEESSVELGTFKLLRDLVQDGRKHNEKLVEGYGSIIQASTSTALLGLQLVEEMGRTRNQLSVEASHLQRAPTAADINHRVQTVVDKLEKPATIIAAAVADRIRNTPGPSNPFNTTSRSSANTPPGSSANAPPIRPSQADAQAFFESLTGDQKDAVRDLVTPSVFAAIVEVIMGPPEQWAGEVQDFKNIIRQHAAGLRAILTPEQLLLALALLS